MPHDRDLTPLIASVERELRHGQGGSDTLRLEALWCLFRKTTPEARARAVSLLALALEAEPRSPRRQNDLAAALLLRGELDRRPGDWAEALDLADRAADSGLVEAAINRALALDLLTLRHDARSAWADVASCVSWTSKVPAFSISTRTNVAALTEERAGEPSEDLAALRRRGERLLGRWGIAHRAQHVAAASAALEEAEKLAHRHAAASGDHLLGDAVAAIRAAAAHGGARVADLAAGHADYELARGAGAYAACGRELRSATRALLAGRTPFAGWALVDQAICAFYEKDFGRSSSTLARALDLLPSISRYPTLSGRSRWILGLIRTLEGRFADAERELARASKDFSAANEPSHVGYLQSLLAKAYENGGEPDAAWQCRLAALTWRHRVAVERTWTILDEASRSLEARGLTRARLRFLNEQARVVSTVAVESPELSDLLSYTLLQRAVLRRDEGDTPGARTDVERAERSLTSQALTRRRVSLEIAAIRPLLSPTQDRSSAVHAIDHVIRFFRSSSAETDRLEVLRYLRLRAQLLRSLGRSHEAETDLRTAIDELERQRRGLVANEDRARFEAYVESVYGELLDLLLAGGRTVEALALFESMSNRWWLDARPDRARPTGPPAAAVVPPGTAVARYGYFGNHLSIWLLIGDAIEYVEVPVSRRRLDLVLHLCREEEMTGSGPASGYCDQLAAWLLPRRLSRLAAGSTLVVVADPVVEEIPLGALRFRPGGPYLVERLRLSISPSALSPLRDDRPQTAPIKALFVADPAFDTARHPRLRRLSGAVEAAERSARAYGSATLLAGAAAQRDIVLEVLGSVQVAQFDVHGINEPGSPEASGILLADAADRGTDSLLVARDVLGRRLDHLDLVVLAGCDTNATPYAGTSQLGGLATAFLSSGAAHVVTSSWDVENGAATHLLAAFHRCYAETRAADKCLRTAQLALLHSADPVLRAPRSWAAYQIYTARWNRPPASVH